MNGTYTSWTRATSPSPGCYFTPVHGDTGKTLYIPYAGWRNYTGGMIYRTNNTTGSALYWSSTANPTDNTRAWIITTENYGLSMQPSGIKLTPYSVRCVRSGSGGVPLSAIPSEGGSDPWGDGGQNNL